VNRRGFPNDSRYSRITSVAGSSSQNWRRSLPETSALFPTLTNVENPSPYRPAAASAASPTAPLWDDIATRPAGGNTGENEAFNLTAGSALSNPRQFGPTIRIPYPRT
jgi:hypothetical protein